MARTTTPRTSASARRSRREAGSHHDPAAAARPDTHPRRRPAASAGRRRGEGGRGAADGRRAAQEALDRALDASLARQYPEVDDFAELGVPRQLVEALTRRGITAPFAIQTRSLPDALSGRDVLGRAQTGSGKTLAFGLALLTRLAGDDTGHRSGPRGRREPNEAGRTPLRVPGAPRALVLVPTRELALQVAEVLSPFADRLGLRVTTVYGGARYGRQLDALARGVDVVIATPGRLVDLIERGACRLDLVEVTVLDEADYMADLGFLPVVTGLLERTPAQGQRLLFSATLDRGVASLVERFLTDPVVHAVTPTISPVTSMDHRVFTLAHEHKTAVVTEIAGRPGRTLIFVRTKHGADRLRRQLERAGVEAVAIHGDLNQGQRQRALASFSAGVSRVLVATDVAARGIHVDGIDLVVHYDPPNDHKDYVHRSGRTARAGAAGTVLALVEPGQVRDVQRLHEAARVQPTVVAVAPGHEAVRTVATSGQAVEVRRDLADPGSGRAPARSRRRHPDRRGTGSPARRRTRQRTT